MALSQASNRYKIDGADAFDEYGLIVSDGSDDFLRFPKLKEPLSHDWDDTSGREYDLSTPTFETRQATLVGWIVGNNADDFWDKYRALYAKLKEPGARTIRIVEFEQEFKCFYREMPKAERVTPAILSAAQVYARVEIRFEILSGGFIADGDGTFYFGPVASFPTTWGQIVSLPQVAAEGAGDVLNMQTGTLRTRFAFALRSSKNIHSVIDLNASNSDIYSEYIQRGGTINNPDGIAYKVMGMQQGIAYQFNHVHQFIVK